MTKPRYCGFSVLLAVACSGDTPPAATDDATGVGESTTTMMTTPGSTGATTSGGDSGSTAVGDSTTTAAETSTSSPADDESGDTETTGTGLPRVTENLAVLYGFDDGGGTVVHDVSGVGQPINLAIATASAVAWGPRSLTLTATNTLSTTASLSKLVNPCDTSGEVTLEAWLAPLSSEQTGPATVMTLATATETAFRFGQSTNFWSFELNTSVDSPMGSPAVSVAGAGGELKHVVYTRATDGTVTVYIDAVVKTTEMLTGDFSTWPARPAFMVGNHPATGLPWLGELGLLAVYCRALSEAEVQQNFDASY